MSNRFDPPDLDCRSRHPRRRLSALVGLALPASMLLGGCAPAPQPGPGEDVGEAHQLLTTCVTLKRGFNGTVTDARLNASQMNTNYGAAGILVVDSTDEALIQFDLSQIPSYAVVNSATLNVYTNGAAGTAPINVHSAVAPWNESTVTYASFNQQFGLSIRGIIQPSSVNAMKSVDLTALTQQWVSGQKPNYGVLLESSSPSTTVFISSEGTSSTNPTPGKPDPTTLRPELALCYTTPTDYCAPAPCQNGGTCTNGNTGYTCACAPGFTGADCQTNIDDCAGTPCQNGGACTDGVNSYACQCPAGYSGANCETLNDNCAPSPCQNGGVCTNGVNSYTCQCPPGYTGTDCETLVNNCATAPCQNGGTCTNGVNTYTCSCATGYAGQDCQINVDECVGNACQNGSTCIDGVASYTCSCLPGFGGTSCENNLDDCSAAPCLNGGSCTDGVNSYMCACAPGYSGVSCEIDINDCAAAPCQNGGICVDGVNSYTCSCAAGYQGSTCQNPAVCVSGLPAPTVFWKGENNALDSSGNGWDGVLRGATFAGGEVGQAFSTTAGDVAITTSAPALASLDAITIDMWININDVTGYQVLFSRNRGVGGTGYSVFLNAGKLGFGVNNGAGVNQVFQAAAALPLHTWHHVTVSRQANVVNLYVNCALVGQTTTFFAGTISLSAALPVTIGSEDTVANRRFRGLIDEVTFFPTQLSDTEISSICAAATAGICTGVSTPPDLCIGVTCVAIDQCHVAGTCDSTTGVCSNPAAPDGTACNDGDGCTSADSCSAGVCFGSGSPCQNGASCGSNGAGYTCSCAPGYTGTDCETAVNLCTAPCPLPAWADDECTVATCDPGTGVCGPLDYYAHLNELCNGGTGACSGGVCHDLPPTCESVACVNGGECLDNYCVCPSGYVGTHCELVAPPPTCPCSGDSRWEAVLASAPTSTDQEGTSYVQGSNASGESISVENSNFDGEVLRRCTWMGSSDGMELANLSVAEAEACFSIVLAWTATAQ